MARLSLTLLGGFRATLDDRPAAGVAIKKSQALLAYLALPLGQAHPRDKLAALLWGDMREPQARAGVAPGPLHAPRRLLGDPDPLRLVGETVALDPRLVERGRGGPSSSAWSAATRQALEAAAALYQGDLLEGLSLQEPPFEEWLIAERRAAARAGPGGRSRGSWPCSENRARSTRPRADRAAARGPRSTAGTRAPDADAPVRPARPARGGPAAVPALRGGASARAARRARRRRRGRSTRQILQRRAAPAMAAREPPRRARDEGPPSRRERVRWPPTRPWSGREVELRAAARRLAGRARRTGPARRRDGRGRHRQEPPGRRAGRRGRRQGRARPARPVLRDGAGAALRPVDQRPAREPSRRRRRDRSTRLGPVWRAELARLLPEIAAAPRPPRRRPIPPSSSRPWLSSWSACPSAQPAVLVFEDLHWADEMSLRLLAFAGRRLAAMAAARRRHRARRESRRATLSPAHAGRAGRRPHHEPARRSARSRGRTRLALARTLVQLPAAVAARGAASGGRASATRSWSSRRCAPCAAARRPRTAPRCRFPTRVRDLIAHRLERLGDRSRRLLAVAAVIGRPFDFALLQRAADLGEAEAAEGVEELVRHRVLHGSGDGLEFTHDRIREVVHGRLVPARRALLHRRVAEALEAAARRGPRRARPRPGLALPRGRGVGAGRRLPRAGGDLVASLRYAKRDAVSCYEQALAALAHLPESRQTREQAAELQFNLAHALSLRGAARARQGELPPGRGARGDARRLTVASPRSTAA